MSFDEATEEPEAGASDEGAENHDIGRQSNAEVESSQSSPISNSEVEVATGDSTDPTETELSETEAGEATAAAEEPE